MTHLTPDQFVDAADGALDATARRHLAACEQCRNELSELVQSMEDAGQGPVPEPSPLFWPHFSARVRAAIQAEQATAPLPRWHGWLRWAVLAPVGALAVLVGSLVLTYPWGEAPDGITVNTVPYAAGPEPPEGEMTDLDREWHALAELVGPIDWDTADEAGLSLAPGEAEVAVLDLSDEERRELSRLIAGEMSRQKS